MKYRKKPVVLEAVKFGGINFQEIIDFVGLEHIIFGNGQIYIHTLEGDMEVSAGDYVIKGVHGEFYPCKPDIFEETYEEIEEFDPHKKR